MGPIWRRRACCVGLALILAGVTRPAAATPDDPPPPSREQVAALVKQLDASAFAERDKAQQALTDLGTAVLPLLPADNAPLSAEAKRRVKAVRLVLEEIRRAELLEPSRISLAGAHRFSDCVDKLARATGNVIVDLRELEGEEATDPEVQVEWKDRTFWEAIDDLAGRAGIGFYMHTGARQLGIMGRSGATGRVTYPGPFRMSLTRIVLVQELGAAGSASCTLEMELAWEPRLNPLVLRFPQNELVVEDDRGNKIAAELPEGAEQVDVTGPSIRTDVYVRLTPPPRDVRKLQLVKSSFEAVVPSRFEKLEFRDLRDGKRGDTATAKGMRAELLGVEATGADWSFDVALTPTADAAKPMESYQDWTADLPVWLQKRDGTRFEHNGGSAMIEAGEGKIGIRYIFVDAPDPLSSYRLVIQIPAGIRTHKVGFEFRDLPLP